MDQTRFRKLLMHELERPDANAALVAPKLPIALVLDNIRSHHNIGALFRTADGLNVAELVLCGITATPPHREIHKTALGATDSVPWTYAESCVEACLVLQKQGFKLVALEQCEGATDIRKINQILMGTQPVALVVGNEVNGVDQAVLNLCEACLIIPQDGSKHSLNVSVAGGVALWELYRHFNSLKD